MPADQEPVLIAAAARVLLPRDLVDLESVHPEQGNETGSAQHPQLDKLVVSCFEHLYQVAAAVAHRHDELSSRDKLRRKRSRDTDKGGRDDDSAERSRIWQPERPVASDDFSVDDTFGLKVAPGSLREARRCARH